MLERHFCIVGSGLAIITSFHSISILRVDHFVTNQNTSIIYKTGGIFVFRFDFILLWQVSRNSELASPFIFSAFYMSVCPSVSVLCFFVFLSVLLSAFAQVGLSSCAVGKTGEEDCFERERERERERESVCVAWPASEKSYGTITYPIVRLKESIIDNTRQR